MDGWRRQPRGEICGYGDITDLSSLRYRRRYGDNSRQIIGLIVKRDGLGKILLSPEAGVTLTPLDDKAE